MSSYPIPCYADMQWLCRRTQEREPAHTGQCLAIQRYDISQYFEIGPRQNIFSDFHGDDFYDVQPTHVDKFLLVYSDYSFLSELICQFNIAFSNLSDFRQL